MQKIRVFIIHGGMTFKSKKDYITYLTTREISIDRKPNWTEEYLNTSLGKQFEIVRLRMPTPDNAHYDEWKIHFERYLPFFTKQVILIGESLGGIFLARYLSENRLPQKALATYLVCPPFDNSLSDEDLVNGFKLKPDLSLLPENTNHLSILFSADDDVVPVQHAEKYREKLPTAMIRILKGKNGHFNVSKLPEIVKMILKDTRPR
ncbi:alpha/beta hydrolase [Candidatus Kaiserbacteria bacterium]|nr:MAG: alpha/beta hydrolase [Candidatus Kaiserbacteria bacterium]